MLRLLATCSCLLVFCSLGAAQNLVVNGDFQGQTLAPWTLNGFAFNPAIEVFDVTGTGLSSCYAATPTTGAFHELSQTISLDRRVTYEVRIDAFASQPGGGSNPPEVYVHLGGSIGTVVLSTLLGDFMAPVPEYRIQRAGLFAASATEDVLLSIIFDYSGTGMPGVTPRVRIDNIVVRPLRNPFIGGFSQPRTIGTQNTLTLSGAPGVPYFLFLSFDLANTPIALPGITGEVLLGPTGLRLYCSGIFGVNGLDLQTIDVPNNPSISGMPIHWQALQFNQLLGIANLGWANTQGFR